MKWVPVPEQHTDIEMLKAGRIVRVCVPIYTYICTSNSGVQTFKDHVAVKDSYKFYCNFYNIPSYFVMDHLNSLI